MCSIASEIGTWSLLVLEEQNTVVTYKSKSAKHELIQFAKFRQFPGVYSIFSPTEEKAPGSKHIDCWQSFFLSKFSRGYEERRFG